MNGASPQTELHRHLDVSARLGTLFELAKRYGLIAGSTSEAAFREDVVLTRPLTDLKSVLDRFQLMQKVLQRPEDLERIAYETVEDCWNEGTRAVELRFSPGFATAESGLSWDECLDAFERGITAARTALPEMRVGLICIGSRELGIDSIAETVSYYLKHRTRFIGLDLAGDEEGYPSRLFEEAFRPAREMKSRNPGDVHITVHAGETGSPDSIWEAIELLGAERIGHGIACVKDPQLLRFLAERKICLEICPTSNWLTGAVSSLEAHPALQILRAGVPVSINTDDPAVFGVTLRDELFLCRSKLGFSDAELQSCLAVSYRSSFLH